MMKVGWLIDAEMFEEYRDELVAAIRGQGHEARLIRAPHPPFRWEDAGCSYRETFPEDACVIAHGDIDLITRIARERRWTPGTFCTTENFLWSHYACWYGDHLLNRDYVMLPFGELERLKDFLFDTLGRDERVFIRPDSPLKLFTGQTATRQTFAADVEFMGFYDFPPSTLVVASSPKAVLAEWRFFIAEGQVITGSQYKKDGKMCVDASYDAKALELAQRIASLDYSPDPVWVLDVCRTAGGDYHLLEIGAFGFADLYACDKERVVAAVSKVAQTLWRPNQ